MTVTEERITERECSVCYEPSGSPVCTDCRTDATPIETTPSGTVVFDLETHSADQLHDHPDPREFVRIIGCTTEAGTVVDTDPSLVINQVLSSRWVIGANLVHFDLPALSRVDPRVDVLALTAQGRVFDTMISDSVLNPILNDKRPGEIARAAKHFALNAACERHGITGKTDESKRLAKAHGGFELIPTDDPEYRAYCVGDVEATRGLAQRLMRQLAAAPPRVQSYLWREHRVHAIATAMGSEGIQVDQELLQRRFWSSAGRKAELTRSLIARYNIPTTKADGKKAESPAATKDGKVAILRALHSLGVAVSDIPLTPKKVPSFGGDAMRAVAETYAEHPNAAEITALCDTVADIAGVRTVYGTALEALRRDGRVHPEVVTFQASGRWSVRKPGLTVFGKRGGKVIERAVFTATDPDHVLMAIDLSQIDSRSIAVHSQDPAYLALFTPGLDAHEIVARMVWGDGAYDAEPKRLRDTVKGITHGLPYGMGIPKLAAHAKVPESTAERVVATMSERFPRLQTWKAEVREQASSQGAILDNGFGRLMMVDHVRAYTQAPALMGQGTARDLMMQCLLNVADADPRVIRMLRIQVHDEAVFEFPRADAEELRHLVEHAFTFDWAPPGAPRPVSIVAEGGPFGFRWSECY